MLARKSNVQLVGTMVIGWGIGGIGGIGGVIETCFFSYGWKLASGIKSGEEKLVESAFSIGKLEALGNGG
jgi:hypothetical protein